MLCRSHGARGTRGYGVPHITQRKGSYGTWCATDHIVKERQGTWCATDHMTEWKLRDMVCHTSHKGREARGYGVSMITWRKGSQQIIWRKGSQAIWCATHHMQEGELADIQCHTSHGGWGASSYIVPQITWRKGSQQLYSATDHMEEGELADIQCHRSHGGRGYRWCVMDPMEREEPIQANPLNHVSHIPQDTVQQVIISPIYIVGISAFEQKIYFLLLYQCSLLQKYQRLSLLKAPISVITNGY